jgi:hypothetical protein
VPDDRHGARTVAPDLARGLLRLKLTSMRLPARSDATSARSDSISAACSAATASSSSYDGFPGCGTPGPNHDHKPDASTDAANQQAV